jgi:hypothetical protein
MDEQSAHSTPSHHSQHVKYAHGGAVEHEQPAATGVIIDKPPADVYERLAARAKLKAQQIYNYEPPQLQVRLNFN